MDVAGSVLALTVLLPLLPLVALAIRLDSRGPVFYRARRVGRTGRCFGMWKFRTMLADADTLPGAVNITDDDYRVTRVGRPLRRYKINELPQFINVLVGDMSLVGPRPEIEHYVRQLTASERQILDVRPGLIDWATLRYSNVGALLASGDDPDRVYEDTIRPEIVRTQLAYVQTWSLAQDVQILVAGVHQLLLNPLARRLAILSGRRPGPEDASRVPPAL